MDWPWTTSAINASGSLALAYFATRVQERLPQSTYRRPRLGTGFCGAARRPFSTWMLESQRLAEDAEVGLAAVNLLASVTVGVAAAALGHTIGTHA